MEGVHKGLTSLVGVGSEEDKEIDRSYSFANKVWGWELEARMVEERGLMIEGSKLNRWEKDWGRL